MQKHTFLKENEDELDELSKKLTILKDLSMGIGTTVQDQEELLDSFGESISSTSAAIHKTAEKVSYLIRHKKVSMFYIVLLTIALLFIAYLLLRYLLTH
ncbi:SNARE domain [Carpediemonas membranifera]|uniref:SNARE domain n=1 Tax=Carpediemonas membranifera TaxID=201153 RepID=A0A8J6AVZ1_9EUKA|nr:SNARE domain [Carpediemonas membranifera]|eukprot:KAG9389598.1 SNARE domain [Carpediemonas membranifera]